MRREIYRALRREEALRGRPVGAHHARSEAAGDGAQGAGRRPRQVTTKRSGWRGPVSKHRHRAATGASSSPRSRRWPTSRRGGWPSCSRRPTRRRASACSRRASPAAPSASERETGIVPLEGVKWAKPPTADARQGAEPRSPQVLDAGRRRLCRAADGKDGRRRNIACARCRKSAARMVAMDPHTGRVLAMVGGFSFDQSQFNRATQAYAPARLVVQAVRLCGRARQRLHAVDRSCSMRRSRSIRAPALAVWRPENYRRQVLRPVDAALRHRAVAQPDDGAARPGHGHAADRRICQALRRLRRPAAVSVRWRSAPARRRCCAWSTAYSMFANGGKRDQADADRPHPGPLRPHRSASTTSATAAAATPTSGAARPSPTLVDDREQVLDPMTAYQITSMMEGVVQRGTATVLREVGKPIAGKTGTTNDEKDAWFIGFSPDLVVGVYHRLRQAAPTGPRRDRRPARGADLQRLHEGGAGRQAGGAVPRAAGHQARPRSTARPACAPAPATRACHPRSLQARHRAARRLFGDRREQRRRADRSRWRPACGPRRAARAAADLY